MLLIFGLEKTERSYIRNIKTISLSVMNILVFMCFVKIRLNTIRLLVSLAVAASEWVGLLVSLAVAAKELVWFRVLLAVSARDSVRHLAEID